MSKLKTPRTPGANGELAPDAPVLAGRPCFGGAANGELASVSNFAGANGAGVASQGALGRVRE